MRKILLVLPSTAGLAAISPAVAQYVRHRLLAICGGSNGPLPIGLTTAPHSNHSKNQQIKHSMDPSAYQMQMLTLANAPEACQKKPVEGVDRNITDLAKSDITPSINQDLRKLPLSCG